MKKTRRVIKSSVSGRFVSKAYAKKRGKHTTFSQKVSKSSKRRR